MNATSLSRRNFLKGTGLLIVGFSLGACTNEPAPTATPRNPATAVATERAIQAPDPPAGTRPPPSAPSQPLVSPSPAAAAANAREGASVADANQVDSWLAVAQDGSVTVFSGKVELGTGIQTALAQIAAEELGLPVERITMVMGDTARTPDEGYTAGSKSLQVGGVALRKAAAEARQALLGLASEQLKIPANDLVLRDGRISARSDAGRSVTFADLLAGKRFNRTISGNVQPKAPAEYQVVGKSVRRTDLPGKIYGAASYVQDHTLPNMLHGRVVRPAGFGATLRRIDEDSIRGLPGIVKVVRNGNFVGVVAEREEQAIQAAEQLKVEWDVKESLPREEDLYSYIRGLPSEDKVLVSAGDVDGALKGADRVLTATYYRPYMAHASMGPSCAVADVQGDHVRVWSSTQGVFPLRGALAQLLGVPVENVHVVHREGAGCYGHNGFDDVAADAALLSKAVGRPVRVQWSRGDEFGWEPKGPAMVMELRGAVDGPRVVAWDYGVWTPTHSTRPGGMAGNLLAGQLVDPAPPPARNGFVGGDRNAKHNYTFANNRVVAHWLSTSPLRPSAFRGLGASANAFAIESFMDELAAAARVDPVEFRLRHLDDPRAIAVVKAAAERAGWQARPSPGPRGNGTLTGRGIAFARYESEFTYAATVAEVEVEPASGVVRVRRIVVGHDCGLIVNPDGLRNQIEGGAVMATSWALKEAVRFDRSKVTSLAWDSYPILTFPEVPDVEVVLLNQPDQPAWGAGEPAAVPVMAAIGNAIFDATGARLRTVPFTPERVKAALAST